jgi:hypothetical protein
MPAMIASTDLAEPATTSPTTRSKVPQSIEPAAAEKVAVGILPHIMNVMVIAML